VLHDSFVEQVAGLDYVEDQSGAHGTRQLDVRRGRRRRFSGKQDVALDTGYA
jgi:hypothetical protein